MLRFKTNSKERSTHVNFLNASIIFLFLILLIYGCGGGGHGSDSSSDSMMGVFIDSPVGGVSYDSESHSGTTNEGGEFFFTPGETMRFMLADIYMGQAPAESSMTPIHIVDGATNSSHPTVTNMIRFMQSIDIDGNPDNGINIPQQIRDEMTGRGINFYMGTQEFEHDPNVYMLMDSLNAMNMFGGHREMVSPEQARAHMDETMRGDDHNRGGPPGDDDHEEDGPGPPDGDGHGQNGPPNGRMM
jgi:hypothetical protein